MVLLLNAAIGLLKLVSSSSFLPGDPGWGAFCLFVEAVDEAVIPFPGKLAVAVALNALLEDDTNLLLEISLIKLKFNFFLLKFADTQFNFIELFRMKNLNAILTRAQKHFFPALVCYFTMKFNLI